MRERVINVRMPGREYRVMIREGLLQQADQLLNALFNPGKVLLVSDTKVFDLFGKGCVASLEEEGWQVAVCLIRPGERSKTISGAIKIYDKAVEVGLDRSSPVIALGGGVVGDLAGFAAATYMRGVPLVSYPTTLLAQVDSSVGGKVAVNHPRGKNLIGTFYRPAVVAADPAALGTLPLRQLRAGAAEVIKYGIIKDRELFDWLELNLAALKRKEPCALAEAVERSVRVKAEVVEEDEEEADYRRILNFGHTVGHALEAATGYRYYLHGEAVLVGMAAAVEISRLLGLIRDEEADRVKKLLGCAGMKKPPSGITPEAVMESLQLDKKHRGGKLIFVLPRAIGRVECREVKDRNLLKKVIEDCLAAPFS